VVQDDPVSFIVRQLATEVTDAAWQLGFEAFGVPSPSPGPATLDLPGRTWFGAFVDNVLVGLMIDRAYDSYFGGAPVPTCGIAAVTVAAEYRGQGALSPLFTETLRFARERGAVISTLFRPRRVSTAGSAMSSSLSS
jgi:GNAT superfamily N-acetyltransferase